MRPRRAVTWALVAVLLQTGAAVAGLGSRGVSDPPSEVDRWHRLHRYYSMDLEEPEGKGLRFGLCPGAGFRMGSPGTGFAVADLYLSVARRRSFSLFAGVGVESTTQLRSAVFTLGWGGVRKIHVARYQTGFFGAFLRYRSFLGEVGRSRNDAFSAGTELGAGHLGFTFEVGASRRVDGQWKLLIYGGFKVVWAIPLGW